MNNILLVDDNKYVLEALALTLSIYTSGYTILKAKDGREAADILDRLPVAVVLTDIQMPVMNGYKLIDYRNRFHPSVPLLAMTSDLSPEVVEQLRSLGITQCMEKPFDYEVATRLILKNLPHHPSLVPPRENIARLATV
jgi:CheY-like chemotaxis protein